MGLSQRFTPMPRRHQNKKSLSVSFGLRVASNTYTLVGSVCTGYPGLHLIPVHSHGQAQNVITDKSILVEPLLNNHNFRFSLANTPNNE